MPTLQSRVGAQVRALRTSLLYTQEEIAEKAGITHGHLGAIERGASWPSGDVLDSIASALNTAPRLLMPEEAGSSEADSIYAIACSMPPKKVRMALSVMREIAKG